MKMLPKLGKISLIFHVLVDTDRKYYGIYLMAEISLRFLIFAPLIVIFPIFLDLLRFLVSVKARVGQSKDFLKK